MRSVPVGQELNPAPEQEQRIETVDWLYFGIGSMCHGFIYEHPTGGGTWEYGMRLMHNFELVEEWLSHLKVSNAETVGLEASDATERCRASLSEVYAGCGNAYFPNTVAPKEEAE